MCDIPNMESEELTTGELQRVIKDAAKFGFSTFVFSGGEPLLREDIFDLISFVKDNRMTACLTSNGYLLNEETAKDLHKAKIDVVNISIEGPKQTHDYLRGEGTFDKAITALNNLRKNRIETTIATMVSRYNYQHLTYILELAKEYGVSTIRFQPFSKIFISDILKEKSFLIDKEAIRKAQEIIEQIVKLCNEFNISTNPVSYLRAIPFYLKGKKKTSHHGCPALWTTCSINARGDIFPCWVFNNGDKLIGNVRKVNLYELWNSKRHDEIKKSILKEGCPGCMMSCYDGVFDQDSLKKGFFKKVKKIKDIKSFQKLLNKSIQYLKAEISQFRLRFRFYKSYRGSFKKILIKIFKNIQRKIMVRNIDNKNDIERTLREIAPLKEKLKKEIANYK
jgi:radical SAM protein with 4Fe4S-binding SPASM domain